MIRAQQRGMTVILADKKVLVTGGAGFLGQHVLTQLAKAGVPANHLTLPRSRDLDLRVWEIR
jgi:GDP-L-fucose synthase